jgi:hypothetical protein
MQNFSITKFAKLSKLYQKLFSQSLLQSKFTARLPTLPTLSALRTIALQRSEKDNTNDSHQVISSLELPDLRIAGILKSNEKGILQLYDATDAIDIVFIDEVCELKG